MADDVDDRRWVDKRRIIQLRSSAAIAFYRPKAVRQLPTQMQSFAEISREPESGRAAIASPAPKPDLLQTTPLRSLACNHYLEADENQCIAMTMPRHLAVYLALVLAALLPFEAAYAAMGCASVAAMDDHKSDCGDCMDGERQQCRAYCIALCQSFPASQIQEVGARAKASADRHPHETAFLKILPGGPEPPPPRLAQ